MFRAHCNRIKTSQKKIGLPSLFSFPVNRLEATPDYYVTEVTWWFRGLYVLQNRDSASTYKISSGMKEVKTYAYVNEIPKMNIYTSEDTSSYMFSFATAWGKREAYFVPN